MQTTFGNLVRQYMKKRGLTQVALALKVGVSRRTIQNIVYDRWDFKKAEGMIGLRIVKKLRIPICDIPNS